MLELAREYDCAIRYPFTEVSRELEETAPQVPDMIREFNPRMPDVFYVNFYDEKATKEEFLHIINHAEEGTGEIMCHPGFVNERFAQETIYNFQRERELKILTDPAVMEAVRANGIELISFADL